MSEPVISCESALGAPFRQLGVGDKARLARAAGASAGRSLSLRRSLALQAAFSDDREGRDAALRLLGPAATLRRTAGRAALSLRRLRAPVDPFEAALCAHAYGWSFIDDTASDLFGPYPAPAPTADLIGVWRCEQRVGVPGLTLLGFRSEAHAAAFMREHEPAWCPTLPPSAPGFNVRARNLVVLATHCREQAMAERARASVSAFLADALGLSASVLETSP